MIANMLYQMVFQDNMTDDVLEVGWAVDAKRKPLAEFASINNVASTGEALTIEC